MDDKKEENIKMENKENSELVSIDSDYPSQEVIENLRTLKIPKLVKLTSSLF